jgi:uncharacterized protein (DUF305 family)
MMMLGVSTGLQEGVMDNKGNDGRLVTIMGVAFLITVFVATSLQTGAANHSSHTGMDMSSGSTGSIAASTGKTFVQLMNDAMAVMDQGMESAPMTGDPDHDFAAMMIPHHQGAVDMARAELLYGKDPVLRRLAQEIIVTQEQEIEVMLLRLKQFKTK